LADCQDCGACCFSETDRHARVTGDDYARLGDDAERLVVFIENQAFMRIDRSGPVGRCAALAVLDDGRFACSVYERRPEICRSFDLGSPPCEGERATKLARSRRLLTALRG
jgi:Fe-S-cluster containining protein